MFISHQPPYLAIADELGYYSPWNSPEERLKKRLLDVVGVPNSAYLSKDGQVFVFDMLVQLVKKAAQEDFESIPKAEFERLALSLVVRATVPAIEAVRDWGVVPEPYELRCEDGIYSILHRPFKALIPGTFNSKEEAEEVLAKLISGGVQSGAIEAAKGVQFTYRGQVMALLEPLSLDLPVRPDISAPMDRSVIFAPVLPCINSKTVCEFLSQYFLLEAEILEGAWGPQKVSAMRISHERAKAWSMAGRCRIDEMDPAIHELDLIDTKDTEVNRKIVALRGFYPELTSLSDLSLLHRFECYKTERCKSRNADPERDTEFFSYLLGRMIDQGPDAYESEKAGYWVAYALLRGDPLEEALKFGRAAQAYDTALRTLIFRLSDAMLFLEEGSPDSVLRGRKIKTATDGMVHARSLHSKSIVATQKIEDFAGTSMLESLKNVFAEPAQG